MVPRFNVEEETGRLWRALTDLRQEVAVLKAVSGKVSLSPGVLGLMWGILVAIVTLAVFVARLDETVKANGALLRDVGRSVTNHVEEPGHRVSLERIIQLDRRLDALEKVAQTRR